MSRLKLFTNKFSLAWIACILVMVQGNISIINLNHVMTAAKTGVLTGLIVVAMSFIKWQFKFKLPLFVFIGCFIGDLIAHPTHFGNWYSEALVTALVAGGFSYFVSLTPAGQKLENYFK